MEKSKPAPATPATDGAPASAWKRLGWFVALWALGVAAVGALSLAVRALLG